MDILDGFFCLLHHTGTGIDADDTVAKISLVAIQVGQAGSFDVVGDDQANLGTRVIGSQDLHFVLEVGQIGFVRHR